MPLAKDGMVAMFEERDLPTLDKSDPQRLFRASIFSFENTVAYYCAIFLQLKDQRIRS